MTCKHDPLYRINNEAAGGAGCPICAAERRKRVVMVSTASTTKIDPEWRRGWISKTALQDDIDRYGERGDGLAGNEPERCESGGFG